MLDFSKLRLSSFKSFVEPIEIDIKDGLTGVVGPNGCGKSNLVEAIRWVMGEASYKSMRASSMEGVIFQGTQNRPSRNSAEVSLVLNNKDRDAPLMCNPYVVFLLPDTLLLLYLTGFLLITSAPIVGALNGMLDISILNTN